MGTAMSFRPALSVLMLTAACALAVNADPPAPDGLADRFELVAFYDEVSGEELRLRRWQEPIRIQIGQANAAPYRDAALQVIATLDGLTPMAIAERRRGESANVLVLIGTRDEMEAFWRQFPAYDIDRDPALRFDCMVFAYPGPGLAPFELGAAFVLIDSDIGDAGHIRRCLAQELTQALGLMNDIDDPHGTVFSSRTGRETLSRSDEQMVRILYDPRLETGMSRAEAMPIVRAIAAEMEAGPPIN